MSFGLLNTIKRRFLNELQDTIEQNENYANKVKVYHKFPYDEIPMMGVVLRGVSSATRMRLSPDDYATTQLSCLSLAGAGNHPGRVLKWVNEDQNNLVKYMRKEDLSSQLSGTINFGTNRIFKTSKKPIVAGPFNLKRADNFAQIEVIVNNQKVFAEYVNGEKGIIILEQAPVLGSVVTVSYYYSNLTPPGRYYLEVINPTQFMIDPLYIIKKEEVIARSTGLEITTQLLNKNLQPGFDVLFIKKYSYSNETYLCRGTDYTIDYPSGIITLLNHLPVGVTLYASYHFVGTSLGPFLLPTDPYQYNNTVLPGVVLAFSNLEFQVGDKNVIIVYPDREVSSRVYSGHWDITLDIDVFCRDTLQLPDLVDHIINDMWSRKRLVLINEGITLNSVDANSESEEIYDDNTSDLYYHQGIPINLISEWKRFEPYLTEIEDYNINMNTYPSQVNYCVTQDGRILEPNINPINKPFEVTYPELGFMPYV